MIEQKDFADAKKIIEKANGLYLTTEHGNLICDRIENLVETLQQSGYWVFARDKFTLFVALPNTKSII